MSLKDKINQLETKKQNTTNQTQLDKIDFELSKLYSSIDLKEINTNTTESLLNYMNMASKYEFKHKLESKINLPVISYNVIDLISFLYVFKMVNIPCSLF